MSAPDFLEPGADDASWEAELRAVVRSWMDEHASCFGPATSELWTVRCCRLLRSVSSGRLTSSSGAAG
jgi:hypothetical protein